MLAGNLRSLALLALVAVCGCATIPSDDFDALQRMNKALLQARKEYLVQPGDTLRVTVFRGGSIPAEYRQDVTVQPDGRITLVNVERPLSTIGLTVEEVQAKVQEAYYPHFVGKAGEADYRVTLQFLSSSKSEWLPDHIYLTGQVRRPQAIPYRNGLTIMQAVAHAGGWNVTADESEVVLLRQTPDGQTVTRVFNLEAVVEHSGDDMELFPGDVVFVPLSVIAKVNLFVEFYIRNMIPINPSSIARLATGV